MGLNMCQQWVCTLNVKPCKMTLYSRCYYCHISQMKLMRHRDDGTLSWGHRDSKSWSWDLNSACLDPELMFLAAAYNAILLYIKWVTT